MSRSKKEIEERAARKKLRNIQKKAQEGHLSKLNPVDLAYLAGIVDGEGCISINRQKQKDYKKHPYAYRGTINVHMTSESTIRWIHKTVKLGSVCFKPVHKKNHKNAWTWAVWSKQAALLIVQLLPYLKLKKKQGKLLLKFQNAMNKHSTKPSLKHMYSQRSMYIKMRSLKQC
jgi:hypothetical protein